MSSEGQHRAEQTARALRREVLLLAPAIGIVLVAGPALGWLVYPSRVGLVLLLIGLAAGLCALVYQAHLWLDAHLFRLMASHPDDAKGSAAVDELLARMGLRSLPDKPRSLDERIQGTARIVRTGRLLVLVVLSALGLACLLAWNGGT